MTEPSVDPEVEPRAEARPQPSQPARYKPALRALGAFILSLVLGLIVSFTIDRNNSSDRVLRGVVLSSKAYGDRPLAGLTRAALQQSLGSLRQQTVHRPRTFKVGSQRFKATPHELGVDVDEAAIIHQALALGRSGTLPGQFFWWVGRLFTPAFVELELGIDHGRLATALEDWQNRAAPKEAAEPAVFYDGELRARYPSPRAEVDIGAVERSLPDLVLSGSSEAFTVPMKHVKPLIDRAEVDARLRDARQLLAAPIVLVTDEGTLRVRLTPAVLGAALRTELVTEPQPGLVLTLQADELEPAFATVRPLLERPARSATFEVDVQHHITITPSKSGVRIDEEGAIREALSVAMRPDRIGRLPLKEETPQLTTEEAEALNITKLVSDFTTHHACCQARVKNIHFAASQADGIVLRPGEKFSLNELLGPRTNEAGFLDAPAIVGGKMQDSPGGGISQFATTLFNAVLDGGYEIVQRQPHTFYFSRYPEGHEATVSYPLPDLVFRNDTSSGLLIKTRYAPTYIRVLLYGDNEGRRVERHVSERFDLVDPPVEYEPNERLAHDQRKRVVRGHHGWSVIATRILHYPDGEKVEQRRRVTYNPRPDVLEVHPCNIPKGKKGYTGEKCPEPEPEPEPEPANEDAETKPPASAPQPEPSTNGEPSLAIPSAPG